MSGSPRGKREGESPPLMNHAVVVEDKKILTSRSFLNKQGVLGWFPDGSAREQVNAPERTPVAGPEC